jgi:hypothetical protein
VNAQVVLIGGNGFVGSALAPALADAGLTVTSISRRSVPSDPRVRHWPADLTSTELDLDALMRALGTTPVVAVVNLAARTAGTGDDIWRDTVGAARGAGRIGMALRHSWPNATFINIGSVAEHAKGPFQSAYGRAKAAARELLEREASLDAHIVVGLVFGGNARMERDLSRMIALFQRHPGILDAFGLSCVALPRLTESLTSLIVRLESSADRSALRGFRIRHETLSLRDLCRKCGVAFSVAESSHAASRMLLFLEAGVRLMFATARPLDRRIALFLFLTALGRGSRQHWWNHYLAGVSSSERV